MVNKKIIIIIRSPDPDSVFGSVYPRLRSTLLVHAVVITVIIKNSRSSYHR